MKIKKLYKRFYLLVLMFTTACVSSGTQAQNIPVALVNGYMKQQAKPVLIFISTDWCKYCTMQKQQIAKSNALETVKNLFYFVEFDANSQEEIIFNEQKFAFKPNGWKSGIHELAVALNGDESVVFPTWVLLDTSYQVLYKHHGVLSKQQIKQLMFQTKQFHSKKAQQF